MKKTLIAIVGLLVWMCGIASSIGDDEKSDAELLEFARNRAEQVRVTPDPVEIVPAAVFSCIRPTPEQEKKEALNPHRDSAILVYANPAAAAPLWDPYEKFPVGSILLKERFDVAHLGKPTLFTGMIKREPGYFPDVGDWEFFTMDGDLAEVTSRGKLESCAACHRDFATADFVSKQYAALASPHRSAFIDGQWRSIESIAANSDGVFYLPACLAETHGSKLSRADARQSWSDKHGSDADEKSHVAPEDLSSVGGPTLRYEAVQHKNTLGYWTRADDWASWTLDVRSPGDYQVAVLQGCGKGSGGAEVAVRMADQTLSFLVDDTGHFQNFVWRDIGKIRIEQPGKHTLVVKPITKPGVAVMDLRQIVLRPATDHSEK